MLEHQKLTAVGDNSMTKTRQAVRNAILDRAKPACDKFGGVAEIGDGYVIVDTKKHKVVAR